MSIIACSYSEGEFLGMSLEEARGRIAALVADGWRVTKAV